MTTRVFALGANPHTCAPLFYSKPKALAQGLKRMKIVKIGEHYFRATQASFNPAPKPVLRDSVLKVKADRPDRLPNAEIPGLRYVPPAGVQRRRELVIPPSDCFLLQAAL